MRFYLVGSYQNHGTRDWTISGPWNSKGQANRELRAYVLPARSKLTNVRVEAR